MHFHLRIAPALVGVCLLLSLLPSAATAAGPATVTVRVEGLSETKLPATTVTTTAMPLVKDGNPAHACGGGTALAALDLATGGNWSGPWNEGFSQYEIFTIEGETHLFEPTSNANYFWSLWIDEHESEIGACDAPVSSGDRVLLFPSCFGSECPPPESPLSIEAPATANVGEAVNLTVKRFSSAGEGTPAVGASVSGGSTPVSTDTAGHAQVTFAHAGTVTLDVSAPNSVRTEATVCVHNGNDGTCGTTAPSPTSGGSASSGVAGFTTHYTGPYALVASLTGVSDGHVYGHGHGPRLLAGKMLAHNTVSSVSLSLRRSFRGRCSAYDGTTTRFVHARCGTATPFPVATGATFSYLLPEALKPGRYVLDVQGTDSVGNHTTLARGSTRIVFYVR